MAVLAASLSTSTTISRTLEAIEVPTFAITFLKRRDATCEVRNAIRQQLYVELQLAPHRVFYGLHGFDGRSPRTVPTRRSTNGCESGTKGTVLTCGVRIPNTRLLCVESEFAPRSLTAGLPGTLAELEAALATVERGGDAEGRGLTEQAR